jgi:hypothetical protein
MSSVVEIENALSLLPIEQVEEVAAWLDDYRQMVRASAEMFSLYDEEEEG